MTLGRCPNPESISRHKSIVRSGSRYVLYHSTLGLRVMQTRKIAIQIQNSRVKTALQIKVLWYKPRFKRRTSGTNWDPNGRGAGAARLPGEPDGDQISGTNLELPDANFKLVGTILSLYDTNRDLNGRGAWAAKLPGEPDGDQIWNSLVQISNSLMQIQNSMVQFWISMIQTEI